jgi:hypothetical protein
MHQQMRGEKRCMRLCLRVPGLADGTAEEGGVLARWCGVLARWCVPTPHPHPIAQRQEAKVEAGDLELRPPLVKVPSTFT